MVSTQGIIEVVLEALVAKALQPRDLAVLMAVMANVNWRVGRANVTQRSIARDLGIRESNCSLSISRLRDAGILARGIDQRSGHAYYLINPRLGWVGSTQRRGHLFQQWDELTHVPSLDDVDGSR